MRGHEHVDVVPLDLASMASIHTCAADVLRTLRPSRRAPQQRGRHARQPARHRRRLRDDLRRQPPRPLPAHQPAARPARGERAGAHHHRGVRRAPVRAEAASTSTTCRANAALPRVPGVLPLEARQHPLRQRARPPARRHRRHVELGAPRLGRHQLLARRRHRLHGVLLAALGRPFAISPAQRRRHDRVPRVVTRGRRRDRPVLLQAAFAKTSAQARDDDAARRLWDVSEQLVGLTPATEPSARGAKLSRGAASRRRRTRAGRTTPARRGRPGTRGRHRRRASRRPAPRSIVQPSVTSPKRSRASSALRKSPSGSERRVAAVLARARRPAARAAPQGAGERRPGRRRRGTRAGRGRPLRRRRRSARAPAIATTGSPRCTISSATSRSVRWCRQSSTASSDASSCSARHSSRIADAAACGSGLVIRRPQDWPIVGLSAAGPPHNMGRPAQNVGRLRALRGFAAEPAGRVLGVGVEARDHLVAEQLDRALEERRAGTRCPTAP